MTAFVLLVSWIALCVLGHALARRHAFASLVALALLACAAWQSGRPDGLLLVKTISLVLTAAWIQALRMTRLARWSLATRSLQVILVLNVMEAVAADVAHGGLAHLLNAAAGVLLALAMDRDATVKVTGPARDLTWELSGRWIAAFCVWTWTFTHLRYPAAILEVTAALAAAWVAARGRGDHWFQARVFTAALFAVVVCALGPRMPELRSSVGGFLATWPAADIGLAGAAASLAASAGLFIVRR